MWDNSSGCEQCMANLYTWSNVVDKYICVLKVDWIIKRVDNTTHTASVSIKSARKEGKGELPTHFYSHDSVH